MAVTLLFWCASPTGQAVETPCVDQLSTSARMRFTRSAAKSVGDRYSDFSSDNRRPTDVIGGAASQSPECGDAAASSVALSMSVVACVNHCFVMFSDRVVPGSLDVLRLSGGFSTSGQRVPCDLYSWYCLIVHRAHTLWQDGLLKVVRRCS